MMQKLKELINMTAIGEMIRTDAIKEGLEQGARERNIEIVKNMLLDGVGISVIAKYTGLSEFTIREMKVELDVA